MNDFIISIFIFVRPKLEQPKVHSKILELLVIMLDMRRRVRATDRHCRQMRRKIIFGTKKYDLAITSSEKKFSP